MEEQDELWDELMMTIREWNRAWNIFENKGMPPLTASELIREFKEKYILTKK